MHDEWLQTECDRGVKRPHPTQENAFQIFVRSERSTKWVDQSCPAPKVFHPMKCTCLAPPTESPKPPRAPRPSPQGDGKSAWFSRSKPVKRQKKGGSGPRAGKRSRVAPPLQHDLGLNYKVTKSPWEAQDQTQGQGQGQGQGQLPATGIKECPHHRSVTQCPSPPQVSVAVFSCP